MALTAFNWSSKYYSADKMRCRQMLVYSLRWLELCLLSAGRQQAPPANQSLLTPCIKPLTSPLATPRLPSPHLIARRLLRPATMSSYLDKQTSASFRGTLASAAAKLSHPTQNRPASAAASLAATRTASPTPSAASDSNTTPTAKRKRDADTGGVPFSQPQLTGYGAEVKTQMTFAVEYLKKKGEPKSMTDIIDFLSLRAFSDEHKRELSSSLRAHPRVEWKPDTSLAEQTWRSGMFAHRPIIPNVKDATSLLAYLQAKTDASGVAVRDLKDGWPNCEDTIGRLEAEHRLLVSRTKKDNLPRYLWIDDPSLHNAVQPEFQAMWHRVPIPSLEDMHRKLLNVGQKPTSEDPHKVQAGAGGKPKAQKKRASKRSGKATNVHMAHLMQDYSGMRR